MFEILAFVMIAQAAPAAAEAEDASDGNKIVCKSHKFVGTNIRERICKKKSEWDQGKYDAQRAIERRGLNRDVKGVGGG